MGVFRGYDRPSEKFLLMQWRPDSANIREKMLYSSSSYEVRKIFNINWVIEVSDVKDLDFESLYN
jgi:Cofilin/tropomyosin-type actin-binding protein